MKSRCILPDRLLLFGVVTIAFCLSSCKHTNGPSHTLDHLGFQVVKFTNADYADKILAVPYVERTLIRRDGALAYYNAKLDSFELNSSYVKESMCEQFFDTGNQPYIDMGNGYLLVRWPWSGLISRYNFHIPVLLDMDWKDLTSPYQRWAIDDVTVLAEAPFAEYYGFTSETIDKIYNIRFQDILQSGKCQAWKDSILCLDYKYGWDGAIPCRAEEDSVLFAHLLYVQHLYEQKIIELFQSGEYKDVLKEQSKDVHYTSLEELKKNPI